MPRSCLLAFLYLEVGVYYVVFLTCLVGGGIALVGAGWAGAAGCGGLGGLLFGYLFVDDFSYGLGGFYQGFGCFLYGVGVVALGGLAEVGDGLLYFAALVGGDLLAVLFELLLRLVGQVLGLVAGVYQLDVLGVLSGVLGGFPSSSSRLLRRTGRNCPRCGWTVPCRWLCPWR